MACFKTIEEIYKRNQTKITRFKFLVSQVILVTVDIVTDIMTADEHLRYLANNFEQRPTFSIFSHEHGVLRRL
jgi:hypothetical protein